MRDLVELVGLVNKTKLKATGALKFILEPGSKMELLFEAILDKKVQTDEEANLLFGNSPAEAAKLVSLKNKLKERLVDSVFLLDFKDANFSSRQKAFFECYKRWSIPVSLALRMSRVMAADQRL